MRLCAPAPLLILCLVAVPHVAAAQDAGIPDAATDAALPASSECPPDHVGCYVGLGDWLFRDALFDDVMLDTGWVPAGSPIQLRFGIAIGGATEVEMGGSIVTSWPAPLLVMIPGRPGTGRLSINYGLEIVAQLRFDVTVAGVRYRWEGDIPVPYIPEDLRMAGQTIFDPFVLPPSMPRPIEVLDTTDRVQVFRYDALGGLIPIPGVGGGFDLLVQGELHARYHTDRIAVADGSPITEEGGSTVVHPDPGATDFGGAKDVTAHPEGTLAYEGTIWLLPSLYLTFAGTRREFPLAEIPVPVADLASNVVFDDATVHVPLPDIRVSPMAVDMGSVRLGATAEQYVMVHNDGEALLNVTVGDPAAPFSAGEPSLLVPAASAVRLALRFSPDAPGPATAMLPLSTNDPDEPLVVLRLSGVGVGDAADAGPGVLDAGPTGPADEGGCGCRVGRGQRWPGALLLVMVASIAALRRRRRCGTAPRR